MIVFRLHLKNELFRAKLDFANLDLFRFFSLNFVEYLGRLCIRSK